MRGVWREAIVQSGGCAGWRGEKGEVWEGGKDGERGLEGVAEGAAMDVSVRSGVLFLRKNYSGLVLDFKKGRKERKEGLKSLLGRGVFFPPSFLERKVEGVKEKKAQYLNEKYEYKKRGERVNHSHE